MARKKRKAPSINSSSSADLAFTLLIFFLVVTSMDTDEGLSRLLPRWVPEEQQQDQEVKKRNILNVMVNANNQMLVGDDYVEGSIASQNQQLRTAAKNFITASGTYAGERGPELRDVDPEKNPELAALILPKDPNIKVAVPTPESKYPPQTRYMFVSLPYSVVPTMVYPLLVNALLTKLTVFNKPAFSL